VPRLSILIPALGTPEALETTLLSVLENRPHDCQVLVALGIDYSNPYRLDDEIDFLNGAGVNWVDCVNAGVAHCRAEVVHVLGAGTQVEDQWTRHALERFEDDDIGVVTPVVMSAHELAKVVLAGLRCGWGGSRVAVARTTDQRVDLAPSTTAGFYRLEMLSNLGGFSPAVGDEYADLDLALRAAAAGWQISQEPRSRVYGRPLPPHVRGFRSGLCAERFFWRHAQTGGAGMTLTLHGVRVAGELAASLWRPRNLLHCVGRLGGLWPAREIRHEVTSATMRQEQLTADHLDDSASPPIPHRENQRRVA
jgi:hypothetical protein